jgi:X-X-X-Leu-X-X-Gly heptad repeat protein
MLVMPTSGTTTEYTHAIKAQSITRLCLLRVMPWKQQTRPTVPNVVPKTVTFRAGGAKSLDLRKDLITMAKLILSFAALIIVIIMLAVVNSSYNLSTATNTAAGAQLSVQVNKQSVGCKTAGTQVCDAIDSGIDVVKDATSKVNTLVDGANQLNNNVNNAVDSLVK